MASIEISLKELAKLIDFYLREEEIEEFKNIQAEKNELRFNYDAGKYIPNIPLSVRPIDFKKGELVLEMGVHSMAFIGDKILKALNLKIESIINDWLFGEQIEEDSELCLVDNNYIYIPITSIEKELFGEHPFKVKNIVIKKDNITIIFKI